MAASMAPSKWSMSVRGDDSKLLKVNLYVSQYYHILSVPIIALFALSLCGCISSLPQIPNIFLAELLDTSSDITTRLRFGYFGICNGNNDNASFSCSSSILSSADRLATSFAIPLSHMNYALSIQHAISFISPCIAAVVFLFGIITSGVLQLLIFLRKRKLSIFLRKDNGMDDHILRLIVATRVLLWSSCAVTLASAHGMHTALQMLQAAALTTSTTKIIRGGTMEALLWSTFALLVLFNTLMQLSTRTISSTITRFRARKSTPLPFLFPQTSSPIDVEKLAPPDSTRIDSVRKLTTATAQRLALANGVIPDNNHSTTSLRPRTPNGMANDNPLSPNFQALNSPGLRPPLATLGRTMSTNKSIRMRSPSPAAASGLGNRPLSFSQHRANNAAAAGGPIRTRTPMTRIEIKASPPPRPSRENDRLAPLSPELRSILKPGWSPRDQDLSRGSGAASSIYSQPAAGSGEGGQQKRGQWM